MIEQALTPQQLIDSFHKYWFDQSAHGLTWKGMSYMGLTCWKCPFDMWLYQELIHQIRPALIIETGTAFGASALYFANLCDYIGSGKVLSIDLNPHQRNYPRHPRIEYLCGRSSIDDRVVAEAEMRARWYKGAVMVILDSDHHQKHVVQELHKYAPLVTAASYLVVEDTNVGPNDLVLPDYGPGPGDAVREWLPKHPEFKIDARLPARMLFSFHTWLRKERT